MPWNPNKRRPNKRKRMSGKRVLEPPAYIVPYLEKAQFVVGVDECGWGAVAGPVVVAACALKQPYKGPRVRDSKRYSSEKSRAKAAEDVRAHAWYYEVVTVPASVVHILGPAEALRLANIEVVRAIWNRIDPSVPAEEIVVIFDGSNKVKGLDIQHFCVPKGDERIVACSAASILGKVHRDGLMTEMNKKYPGYSLDIHKGYLTSNHMAELRQFGVTPEHRKNIAVIQEILDKKGKYGDQ